MKLLNFIESKPALQKLSETPIKSGKLSYKIAKNLRLVNQELVDYDKTRESLLNQYGTLSEDKSRYEFEPESGKKFTDEMGKLIDVEVDIPTLKLSEDEVESIEGLTPATWVSLGWMIEETK
jgi:hypothetical protein